MARICVTKHRLVGTSILLALCGGLLLGLSLLLGQGGARHRDGRVQPDDSPAAWMVLNPGPQCFKRITIADLGDLSAMFEIQALVAAQWR
jgi:hypothetical protein